MGVSLPLDYQNETPIEDVLASIERPSARSGAALSLGGEAEVFDLDVDGVRVTLLPTSSSRADKAPTRVTALCTSTWPLRCSIDFSRRFC